MKPPSTFETPRLSLRRPEPDDAPAIFESYTRDPDVTRFVTWTAHPSVNVTRRFVEEFCMAGWARGEVYTWLITLVEDAQVAGMIDLRPVATRAEVGYVLARRHWGRGLMTEAARAVVDWAIVQPDIHRVWAVVDLDNVASQRVLEKAGMVREGVLRRWMVAPSQGPVPRDVWCFARVKDAEGSR
ncbi:MAG TPA: GNAT family N-acetyltransferase [Methylomirabilota bacterium]|nr:GNAT family N-acetyltransferase [Methylomirabilota bacterium]